MTPANDTGEKKPELSALAIFEINDFKTNSWWEVAVSNCRPLQCECEEIGCLWTSLDALLIGETLDRGPTASTKIRYSFPYFFRTLVLTSLAEHVKP
jgi:hypothetical protein